MRILFTAVASNSQTARWLCNLVPTGWDIHLFPVDESIPHSQLGGITLHDVMYHAMGEKYLRVSSSRIRAEGLYWSRLRRFWNVRGGRKIARLIMRLYQPNWSNRQWRLIETIRKVKPDIVHSLGIQESALFTLHPKNVIGSGFPSWVVTNLGSDISLMGQLYEYIPGIKLVMSSCDYYFCETRYDAKLARNFGFEKEVLPVVPTSGGLNIAEMRKHRDANPPSARRMILLKGHVHWSGRTLAGLRALTMCADVLKDYRITIYNATPEVKLAGDVAAKKIGIPINSLLYTTADDVTALLGQARVALDVNIGGGVATTFLEAMVMGAFPVHTNTAHVGDWADDGKTTLLVPPDDPEIIAQAVRRALTDDALVDSAAEINAGVAEQRLDVSVIQPQVIGAYERICSQKRG
jgi:glycosyltransferase involved in cell wall biosynthesis